MAGNYFCCARASTTEYNKVAWGGQTSTTSYNIAENKRNVVRCCIVQHLLSEKFDQTSYNKIQHDKTRYNKVAKRVQHFIKHQSCMMLYELLYSFGRGFIDINVVISTPQVPIEKPIIFCKHLGMARQTAQKYFYDSSGYLSGVRYTCLEFDILVWILIYFF